MRPIATCTIPALLTETCLILWQRSQYPGILMSPSSSHCVYCTAMGRKPDGRTEEQRLVDGYNRIQARVVRGADGECWAWRGPLNTSGYATYAIKGVLGVKTKNFLVHRVMYELLVGPIGEGMELDHLCGNRPCSNPDHLEQVTRQENIRRQRAKRTHCAKGHPYPEGSEPGKRGNRRCSICRRASDRASSAKYAEKKKAEHVSTARV